MLNLMPAAIMHRKLFLACALAAYALVFSFFYFFEQPGLGIGHFFYIPIALLALACGARVGILAGLLATVLYALAIVITPRLPTSDVLTLATTIRLITYTASGALVGWFSDVHRDLADKLRELAERDFLTGLLNARVFDDALARRCVSGRPFVLVLGDMDNLKEINDAHGHTEGNRILRRLADVISESAGPSDELARVGGDEFALLTSTSIEDAKELCGRLRRQLALEGLEISFGWASMPEDSSAPLELFRKADDRLYAAKMLGRNRRDVMALTAVAQS